MTAARAQVALLAAIAAILVAMLVRPSATADVTVPVTFGTPCVGVVIPTEVVGLYQNARPQPTPGC